MPRQLSNVGVCAVFKASSRKYIEPFEVLVSLVDNAVYGAARDVNGTALLRVMFLATHRDCRMTFEDIINLVLRVVVLAKEARAGGQTATPAVISFVGVIPRENNVCQDIIPCAGSTIVSRGVMSV